MLQLFNQLLVTIPPHAELNHNATFNMRYKPAVNIFEVGFNSGFCFFKYIYKYI